MEPYREVIQGMREHVELANKHEDDSLVIPG